MIWPYVIYFVIGFLIPIVMIGRDIASGDTNRIVLSDLMAVIAVAVFWPFALLLQYKDNLKIDPTEIIIWRRKR